MSGCRIHLRYDATGHTTSSAQSKESRAELGRNLSGNHGEWILLCSSNQLANAATLFGNAVENAFQATQHFMAIL